MSRYDAVIIGSGLGGLACGAILGREGMRVCVLEKNRSVGGCLQSFRRDGCVFDTGIHYVGSLGEGQTMRQYFRYFGIADRVHTQPLDAEAFDTICFPDGTRYDYGSGYERLREGLCAAFPREREAVEAYCRLVAGIGGGINVDTLRGGRITSGGLEYAGVSLEATLGALTADGRLRGVLAGNAFLYGGLRETASVYQHAMITHSNIEGAHSFPGGSQQIADALADRIRACGGEVFTDARVVRLGVDAGAVSRVECADGRCFEAANVICDLHPLVTLKMLEPASALRPAYFERVKGLRNTYGVFTVYALLEPGAVEYANRNYYLYNSMDVWRLEAGWEGCNIPSVLLCMQPDSRGEYASAVTLLAPMSLSEAVRAAGDSPEGRGLEYEEFKARHAAAMLSFAQRYLPRLRGAVRKTYTSTPLTWRDWTGTPEGSAYGILKDCRRPLATIIPVRTRIKNLLLTGQNVNFSGALGVAVTAALTCAELLGTEYLAKKIGNA